MYRIALILGLLTAPAAAETYSPYECETIGIMLQNCMTPDNPGENTCSHVKNGGFARRVIALVEKHKWDDPKFDAVCAKLCNGSTDIFDEYFKYCPARRPKP
ncbi:hypothetical protein ACRQ5Q_39445 [Bradyrhizobium sp. PMVTL-01]|uniref:hypothetical protein n=1 Tax=Bradyrhizobium sp. PMVTL-01 TaxID=3434999 RepID=UPI003F72D7AC